MSYLEMLPLSQIKFTISGNKHIVDAGKISPATTLNQYLREIAHLTATKKMCLEGGCGSCIVAIEELNPITNTVTIKAVNSCLVRLLSCHGWKIFTNEGIGQSPNYHPIQKILADHNGTQCGFCSSGMVMNMYALYESGPVTEEQIENSFGGNICRCTGYRPILEAFRTLTSSKTNINSTDIEEYVPCYKRNCNSNCEKSCKSSVCFRLPKSDWMKVYNLNDLLDVMSSLNSSSYKFIAGNTSEGVYRSTVEPENFIDISHVKELTQYTLSGDSLSIGANMSLSNIMNCFQTVLTTNPKFGYLQQVIKHIDLIANVPVRNIGTLAGNLMIKHEHKEFPSDMFLLLETVQATVVIVDVEKNEQTVTPEEFLQVNLDKKVITHIILRELDETYKFGSYKIMPKAQNSHAMVNAGFLFKMNSSKIVTARIVYGNINPNFVHAKSTENYLKSKNIFDNTILLQAYKTLDNELKAVDLPPDPQPEFRKQLAISLFYKFILSIAPPEIISSKNRSGGTLLERPLSTARQEFGTNKSMYPVTEPILKLEAQAQTSGRAEYVDDIPDRPGQLFGALVLAKAKPNSVISSIDTSEALKLKDIVGFYDKNSVPGDNTFTPKSGPDQKKVVQEELFCSGTIQYYSQPIGIIIGKSLEVAQKASELIRISYQESDKKPLLTVQDVLAANATERITTITTHPRKKKGTNIKHVIKDDFYVGHQYHAHMEVQCCNIVPTEDGLDIYASTQWMYGTQLSAAAALNIPTSKISVFVRRLGGGFGGKILRSCLISTAAAVAAYTLQKPVKLWMPLISNISAIGKRFPLYVKYEVGVDDSGEIQYLNADLYSDFGVGGNESPEVFISDMFLNMYNGDTWTFTTYAVKTDTPANCFARGPGTTEALALVESIMENIAYTINQDPMQVKLINRNKNENQKIIDFINDMKVWGDTDKRKKDVLEFNASNRWRKRGLAIVPMVWSIELLSQLIVLVSIFQGDGGVSIIHAGIECGQGINTKVAQVCAYKFGIPMAKVSVKPSYNVVTPNCSETGGSITTEGICYALIGACDILLDRMKPYKEKLKNPTWENVVNTCFANFVPLTASSNYTPSKPDVKKYVVYGVCAAEVELDVLTGKHELLKVDIIEDTGESINPLIDIGQTEGAFVMGLGYYTTEEQIMSNAGEILTNRTWNYFLPGPKDIPIDFRIKFPERNPNPVGVLKSKAVAEPPLCLSVAIPLALRNAIASARTDSDNTKPKWVKFNGCTTVEKCFMDSLNDYNQYTL